MAAELVLSEAAMALPEKVRENLLKYRKGATSGFGAKAWLEILETVGGWKVEEKIFVVTEKVRPTEEMRELRVQEDDAFFVIHEVNDEGLVGEGNDQKLVEEKRAAVLGMVKPLPKKLPKRETTFVIGVGPAKEIEWYGRTGYQFSIEAALVTPGYEITAPNGTSYEWYKEPGYRVMTAYELAPFLAKAGLMEQVLELLGVPPHESAPRRDLENTGTCPCCFGNFKLNEGRLVLHGYKRPGYGYVVGNCFCVGYEPFEVSPKGCEDFLAEVLRPALERAKKALAALVARPEFLFKKVKDEEVKLAKGTPDYEALLPRRILEAERNVEWVQADVTKYEKLVENWKPSLLPADKLRARIAEYAAKAAARK